MEDAAIMVNILFICHDIRWTVDWTEHVYEGCDCSR